MAEVDELKRLVQQLQAENADLKHQMATLRQTSVAPKQAPLHAGTPQPFPNRSLPEGADPLQAQFHAFMTHAPVLTWMTNAEGVMGYANPAYLEALGLSEKALGQTVEALFPADLAKIYRQNDRWVTDHQTVLETTEQAKLPNGATRTYLVRKFPVHPPGATVTWVGGFGVDITDLKQTEAALRDSEARWQFAIEGSGDSLWDWNAQTNEVFFSRQWKAMLGYEDYEIGTSLDEWDSRVHPDDKAQCYADLERHFSGETPIYQSEHRVRCRDGSYKWILDRGKVVEWDESGKPLRVIGTHSDVSQRRQIEENLRQSEATNRAILAAMPDLLLRVGRDGTCLSCLPPTDAAAGTFLPVQNHLSEVLPADLLNHQLQRIEHALATGELQVWEHQFEKHGQLCYEEVRLAPCGDEECLVIVRDVSDRKQIELQLEAKVEELDRFFSVSLDLFCIGDTSGYFHRLNSQWEKTLGYSAQEMAGTQYLDYVHPDDVDTTLAALSKLSGQQEVLNFVNRYRCRDGSYRWIEWRSIPVGHLVYGAARDITDRRQAELELQSTKDQLDLVLQASSEGYWDWNLVTGDIYFSPQWKAMLGYADHELENSLAMWETVIFAEDRVAALQLVDDYNTGKVDHFSATQRFHHKDGSTVFIYARAIHLKDAPGQVVRMVGSHLNMTTMVGMQSALQTSEMQLNSVLNSSLDGIQAFRAVRDEAGTIVDFEYLLSNPAACRMLGRSPEQLIGHRLLVELPGHRESGLFDTYVQVVETGQSSHREFYYNHDGLEAWYRNVSVKLGDGFAVTFSNITPLKQSEQQLQQVNGQLEARLDELNGRNQQMQLLGEMSTFLQTCETVAAAHQALGEMMAPLFPDSSGGIFLLSNPADRVERDRAEGRGAKDDRSEGYRVEQVANWGATLSSITELLPQGCRALCQGHMHPVGSDCLALRCTHAESSPAIATLCLPLLDRNEPLGLFYLSAPNFPESTRYLANTVAEQLSLALANLHLRETLKQQSIRDPLTRLFNRRYLEEALAQEIQGARRYQYPVGVIMLDIDHFKRVNDTYGHTAGDRVLEAVGQLLLDSVRGSDIACRYGGEEITLVLPRSSLEVTAVRADEIRQAIGQLQVNYEGMTLNALSVSLGVASFPDHGSQGADAVRAADAALYQAKARGRNQVVVAAVPALKVASSSVPSNYQEIS